MITQPLIRCPLEGFAEHARLADTSVDFGAFYRLEHWAAVNGYSVGRMQGSDPIGLLRGNHDLQKWRNLGQLDREALDGVVTWVGTPRSGTAVVWLRAVAS